MKQREIKFRVFDIVTSTMYNCVNQINFELQCVLAQPNEDSTVDEETEIDFERCVLMQYTGLTDKNGVDIYEGDICELEVEFQGIYNEFYEQPPFHHILTGIVKYMPSTGYYLSIFKGIDVDTEEDIYHLKRKEIVQYRTKLIGNIHEHKHLLK